jgi:hypothetical protein|tara:strand:- start:3981 stop:4982 length:1002 start_codon:yes stop_codon:yes gene_type:complete
MSSRPANSIINIKNIAICLYGQYRTGDACLEYIRNFYESEGYNVDFFCSLKPYTTAYTRPIYNKNKNREIFQKDISSTNELKHQLSQIKKYLSPKLINVYSKEYEDELMDIDRYLIESKVLAGWVDVIMLKQQYEVENDITYDLVVMQRYDTVIYPKSAFRAIVNSLDGISVTENQNYRIANKNFLLMDPINCIRDESNSFYPNGQDMWVLGVGTALDSMAYEFLNYIPSKFHSMHTKTEFYNGFPFTDTHEAIATAADKINIPRFALPGVYPRDICYPPLVKKPKGPYKVINPLPIRDAYFKDNILPNMATLSDDEILKLRIDSIDTWMMGY